MATHSSVLAWRIPGTGEPGGLPDVYGVAQSRTRLKQLSSSSSICMYICVYIYGLYKKSKRCCPLHYQMCDWDTDGIQFHIKSIVIMDITHISSFGKCSYVHVTIDTFSQFIWTATESGETAKHVQRHLYACFAVIKLPKAIKTDNDPAYTSKAFQQFLKSWSIKHSTGIPYNPQGQAIMERANQSLKHRIQKQKGGDAIGQQTISNKALFTLNF